MAFPGRELMTKLTITNTARKVVVAPATLKVLSGGGVGFGALAPVATSAEEPESPCLASPAAGSDGAEPEDGFRGGVASVGAVLGAGAAVPGGASLLD